VSQGARGAAVFIAVALFVGACGSSAGRVTTSSSSPDSTARFTSSYGVKGQRLPAGLATGVIDFTHSRGSATLSQPASNSAPPSAPVQMRWIGDVMYTTLDPADRVPGFSRQKGIVWNATDELKDAQANPCFSGRLGLVLPYGNFIPNITNPAAALDALRADGLTVTRAGRDIVRGVPTTRWSVSLPRPIRVPAKCPSTPGRPVITVWTDAQQRVRRAQTEIGSRPPNQGSIPTPARTIVTTTDFYDFGIDAEVPIPPPAQVFDETPWMVALSKGTGTVDASAWRASAQGTFAGKPWVVYTATTSTGWRCVDPVGVPVPGFQDTLSSGGTAPPRHDGRVVDCEPGIGFLDMPRFNAVIDSVDGNRFVLVGTLDSDVKTARLNFAGGRAIALAPQHGTGIVQWTGPAVTPPVSVSTDGTICLLSMSPDFTQNGGPALCGGATSAISIENPSNLESAPPPAP
jgi:hypothetical protein